MLSSSFGGKTSKFCPSKLSSSWLTAIAVKEFRHATPEVGPGLKGTKKMTTSSMGIIHLKKNMVSHADYEICISALS